MVYRRRSFTEQWAHEASIVPVEHWHLLRHRREAHRVRPGASSRSWNNGRSTPPGCWTRSAVAAAGRRGLTRTRGHRPPDRGRRLDRDGPEGGARGAFRPGRARGGRPAARLLAALRPGRAPDPARASRPRDPARRGPARAAATGRAVAGHRHGRRPGRLLSHAGPRGPPPARRVGGGR